MRGRGGGGGKKADSLDERDEDGGGPGRALPRQGILVEGDFDEGGEGRPVGRVDVGEGSFRRHAFVLDAQHLKVGVLEGDGHRFDAVRRDGRGGLAHPGRGDRELRGLLPLGNVERGHGVSGLDGEIFRQHKVEKIFARAAFHRDVELGVSGEQG